MARHAWNLRSERCYRLIRRAFASANRRALVSVAQYSVQGNHLHLIVESRDRRTLAAGIKGLEVRLARALNQLMGRRGRAFGDRYHTRELDSPSAVRNALAYVLLDRARHFPEWAGRLDPYSSAIAFDGWSRPFPGPSVAGAGPPPIVRARCQLLTTGWRGRGPLDPTTIPGRPRS